MKKISQLDDSYWRFHQPDVEANNKFLAKHKKGGTYEMAGLKLTCPPGIYHPHEFSSTRFALRGLVSQLPNLGPRLLELGTGSGAIGIYWASMGFDVTLLDIDPVAVVCAKNNAVANTVSVTVLQSDLFAAVGTQKYDTIFFNIPLMDKPIEEPLEIISCDQGGALLLRFLKEAPDYLLPNGCVYISFANLGNRAAIIKGLSAYHHDIVHAEFYASTNAWRWLVAARPITS